MRLMEALDFRRGDMAALIGAGGKTTTMYRLAKELRDDGGKIMVTTTTKIFKPTRPHVDRLFLVQDIESLSDACATITAPVIIGAGASVNGEGKLLGLPPSWLDQLNEGKTLDAILVEADGAASRGFKVPAEFEPVIPAQTRLAVWLMAVTVLDKPFDATWVHRADRAAILLGREIAGPITSDLVIELVNHPAGCWRGVPSASRKIAIVNQADDAEEFAAAELLAEKILGCGMERVLITSYTGDEPVKKVLLQ